MSTATDAFAVEDGMNADFDWRQIVVLKDAIEHLNVVLGPVLRRPR